MEIMTRKQARETGLIKYYTGKSCPRGHVAERYVSNTHCIECKRLERKESYIKTKNHQLEKSREWYRNNKERKAKTSREWKRKNREHVATMNKKRREVNRERELEKSREYYKNNREKVINRTMEYSKRRRLEDPLFLFLETCRSMVTRTLNLTGDLKSNRSEILCGYTKVDLLNHLKNNFINGMSLENKGTVWEIDHIVPMSKMVYDGERDVSVINSLSNLRPMFKRDNRSKGNMSWEDWAELYPERAKLYPALQIS